MEQQPIILERLFNSPPSKVWKALTDKSEMKSWYFDLAEFKVEVGFKFEFTGGPSPERQYVHLCEVTEVIPQEKLTYSWSYAGYAGKSFVTFELLLREGKTLLRLTHSGIGSFPADNADFAIGNFKEGWNHIVNISLQEYLGS